MSTTYRFPVFMLVSVLVLVGILVLVLRARARRPSWRRLGLVALIVGPGGMLAAKYGANAGLPWWLFYTVPALLTLLLPVIALRMSRREVALYLVLALLSAPTIHVVFSLTLGWREYMPFLPIP